MDTSPTTTTKRHVRLYLGLGIGIILAATIGLIYVFSGSAS